jgi:transposase
VVTGSGLGGRADKVHTACGVVGGPRRLHGGLAEHPELELSNNLAENSMRPVSLGRKNWIHIGSQQAGPRVAAILSIVESCRRLKIPVRDYLADILPGLANKSIQRVAEVTPAAWAANHW